MTGRFSLPGDSVAGGGIVSLPPALGQSGNGGWLLPACAAPNVAGLCTPPRGRSGPLLPPWGWTALGVNPAMTSVTLRFSPGEEAKVMTGKDLA